MRKVITDYGMVFVLLGLCLVFSLLTIKEQVPDNDTAVAQMMAEIRRDFKAADVILATGAARKDSEQFAVKMGEALKAAGFTNSRVVVGIPSDLRAALDELKGSGSKPAAVIAVPDVLKWHVIDNIPKLYPEFAGCRIVTPARWLWPDFLKWSNLVAIVDRIVVIAVIAIGMTMVIIAGGIDLSVGSLIAMSAVIGTLVMKKLGGLDAPAWAVPIGFAAGIAVCGVVGGLGGWIVARFNVAPFITTLAIMMVGRGLAFMITGGFSIYQVPKALPWLGQGWSFKVPNTVILVLVLYAIAHVFMSHTRMGRYIYAVGGNKEAARLSGIPVAFVTIFVYVVSSLAAGLGGCIQASQINTGTPNMGTMYELYVIAAVVVGGTSLSGGSGKMLGTLIGAFIISVIQNGMNLVGIESYTQQVVLGAVILGAVLLDKARSSGGIAALFSRKRRA
jgi:ribose transport system permease protein